jgi:hypothetical protein
MVGFRNTMRKANLNGSLVPQRCRERGDLTGAVNDSHSNVLAADAHLSQNHAIETTKDNNNFFYGSSE